MTRFFVRVVLALLIVAGALAALRWAIGDDFTTDAASNQGSPMKPSTHTAPDIVVDATDDGKRSAIGISVAGRFDFTSTVETPLPDGSRAFPKRYELHAEDSATVAADLARLDRVTAHVYRIVDGLLQPESRKTATITARVAFVQLGRDAEGRPSIRADRDMDLTDVVLVSVPGSALRDLRLEIARVLVRQDENGIHLRTPDDRMPFVVTFGGEPAITMRGRGLDGFVPGLRGEDDASGRLRLDVAHEPVVTRGAMKLAATGTLRYTEDLATGDGRIAMREAVVVEGIDATATGGGHATAHGDELDAAILRQKGAADHVVQSGGEQRAAWRALTLRGKRARLLVQDFELQCDRLVVTPALDGEPAIFSADGSPTLTERGEGGLSFRAAERIHVIDVPGLLGPLHSFAGFPVPRFGALAQRLFLFEGRAHVDDPKHALAVDAADGLSALRSDSGLDLVRGSGDVALTSDRFTASGDRGFLLARGPRGERVRLGPAVLDPSHRFRLVERNAAREPVTLDGSGRCALVRDAAGAMTLDVASPAMDARIARGDDVVSAMRTLHLVTTAAGSVATLVAEGPHCKLDTVLRDRNGRTEPIELLGERVTSDDGRSLTVIGSPASVVRADGSRLRGERIDVTPFGAGAPAVVVRGTPASIDGVRTTTAGETLALEAARLVVMPSLLPPAVLRAHGIPARSWSTPARGQVFAQAFSQVFAKGALALRRCDGDGNLLSAATGTSLWLLPESESAVLTGSPAVLIERTPNGREFVARAERLRGSKRADGAPFVILEPSEEALPEIDVHGTGDAGPLRDLRIIAAVPIVLDGDRLVVDGDVRVRSLGAGGSIDADGLDVTAAGVDATLDSAAGTLRALHAHGARLAWQSIRAYGDVLRLDVPRTTIEVEGNTADGAWVELPGQRHRGGLVRVDYASRELRVWGPRAGGRATVER